MDLERRFGGINRLYHDQALPQLQNAHICVIGLGGVGSWAVETLVRAGIGKLTLIDLDQVVESNINRQIQALESSIGMAKTDALNLRIQEINNSCIVTLIEDFISPENLAEYLPANHFDWIIDAIDQVKTKAALLAYAKSHKIKIITTGAAGGKTDPTRIICGDLATTEYDPLCMRVKNILRKDYHFPAFPQKFKIPCVYSNQAMRKNASCEQTSSNLNCSGYGSLMSITASFGIMAAGYVINQILEQTKL